MALGYGDASGTRYARGRGLETRYDTRYKSIGIGGMRVIKSKKDPMGGQSYNRVCRAQWGKRIMGMGMPMMRASTKDDPGNNKVELF